MPNMLETAMSWFDSQRKAHMASTVTYRRGADTFEIQASAARSTFEQTDEQGVVLRELATKDWIVSAADMLIDAVAIEPRSGDRITDAGGITYQVTSVGGEPPWRWSDEFRNMMRIHTTEFKLPSA